MFLSINVLLRLTIKKNYFLKTQSFMLLVQEFIFYVLNYVLNMSLLYLNLILKTMSEKFHAEVVW